jgi:hypothetical protein
VIVHAGFALTRLDEEQAAHTLELLARLGGEVRAGPEAPGTGGAAAPAAGLGDVRGAERDDDALR